MASSPIRIRRSRPPRGASSTSNPYVGVPPDVDGYAPADYPTMGDRLTQGAVTEFNNPRRPSRAHCVSRLPRAPESVERGWVRLSPDSRLRALFAYFMDLSAADYVAVCDEQSLDSSYSIGTMRRLAVEYGRASIQWTNSLALHLSLRGVISDQELEYIVARDREPASLLAASHYRRATVRYVAAWGESPPWVREIQAGTLRGRWTWEEAHAHGSTPMLWHDPADPEGAPTDTLGEELSDRQWVGLNVLERAGLISDGDGNTMPNPELDRNGRPRRPRKERATNKPAPAPGPVLTKGRLWRVLAKKNP